MTSSARAVDLVSVLERLVLGRASLRLDVVRLIDPSTLRDRMFAAALRRLDPTMSAIGEHQPSVCRGRWIAICLHPELADLHFLLIARVPEDVVVDRFDLPGFKWVHRAERKQRYEVLRSEYLVHDCTYKVHILITDLHEAGMTIIMVTHDERVADRCERIIRLRDGEIESDVKK